MRRQVKPRIAAFISALQPSPVLDQQPQHGIAMRVRHPLGGPDLAGQAASSNSLRRTWPPRCMHDTWHCMIEVEADQLKDAIEHMHGGSAQLAQSVPVHEMFEGGTVWE